jgi:hypothetical protein
LFVGKCAATMPPTAAACLEASTTLLLLLVVIDPQLKPKTAGQSPVSVRMSLRFAVPERSDQPTPSSLARCCPNASCSAGALDSLARPASRARVAAVALGSEGSPEPTLTTSKDHSIFNLFIIHVNRSARGRATVFRAWPWSGM